MAHLCCVDYRHKCGRKVSDRLSACWPCCSKENGSDHSDKCPSCWKYLKDPKSQHDLDCPEKEKEAKVPEFKHGFKPGDKVRHKIKTVLASPWGRGVVSAKNSAGTLSETCVPIDYKDSAGDTCHVYDSPGSWEYDTDLVEKPVKKLKYEIGDILTAGGVAEYELIEYTSDDTGTSRVRVISTGQELGGQVMSAGYWKLVRKKGEAKPAPEKPKVEKRRDPDGLTCLGPCGESREGNAYMCSNCWDESHECSGCGVTLPNGKSDHDRKACPGKKTTTVGKKTADGPVVKNEEYKKATGKDVPDEMVPVMCDDGEIRLRWAFEVVED